MNEFKTNLHDGCDNSALSVVMIVTPVTAQNMTGGNMTGGNMTGKVLHLCRRHWMSC